MSLPDYPPQLAGFHSGLPDDLLQVLGHLSVISARLEEELHKTYWRYAGLTPKSGPVVTENLNPKRLFEDIIKFAKIREKNEHAVADLKVLSDEFVSLNTKRNQLIHWVWSRLPLRPKDLKLTTVAPIPTKIALQRPVYKQKAATVEAPTETARIAALCNDYTWLETRLRAHGMTVRKLRKLRQEYASLGRFNPSLGIEDVFLPAPWLDKPPLPKAMRSSPRASGKSLQPRPRSSRG